MTETFIPNPTMRRPPADVLGHLLRLEAAGAPQTAFFQVAKAYRGGAIWPFELEIVHAVKDLFPLIKQENGGYDYGDPMLVPREKITEALAAFDPDHAAYLWPFEPQARVTNILPSDPAFTFGRSYTVIQCDDGTSGSGGGQIWVRVENNNGCIYGNDPDRFMLTDEFVAIHEARAGGGTLVRLGENCWTRSKQGAEETPAEAATLTPTTVERLLAQKVFAYVDEDTVRLNERSYKVKKAGVKLDPEEIVAQALARALEKDETATSNYIDADSLSFATLDGHFNLVEIAKTLLADLALEDKI